MFLHLHRPAPPLDRFVELITYYEGYDPGHTKEKLLPDGAVEIIIDLADTPKKMYQRDDHSRWTDFRKAWISGMRRDWIVIEAQPGASMVVIRFRPGGAYPFLGFSVEGITDTVDQLDAVLGEATSSLRDRVLERQGVEARLAAVERWLLWRSRGRRESHPAIEYVAGRLFAPAGVRIRDVVEELGYSQRHVLALFRRWVGVSPKQYGRIRRFQQVLQAVVGDAAEPDWADVAQDHGYYDQAHLIRDFRQFSGLSPTGYLTAYRGLENYLPLD